MAEKQEGMVIVGGVRYRHEDAVRLGLVAAKTAPKQAPVKQETEGVEEDAGTVSGSSDGLITTDKMASDKPSSAPRTRKGK